MTRAYLALPLLAACFSQPPTPPGTTQGAYGEPAHRLAAGGKHACWIAGDAVLYCWGDNTSGQLGVATTSVAYTGTPVAVGTDTGIDVGWTDIAAGYAFTCGILGGVVVCFGANDLRQSQGTQTTNTVSLPTRAVRVFAGDTGACAIDDGGALYCWGHIDDQGSQLASPTMISPGGVAGPWASIAIGQDHSCAKRADSGVVSCWGVDDQDQLGTADGIARDAGSAFQVGTLAYVALAASAGVTCGAVDDGSLACWGTTSSTTIGVTPFNLVDNASTSHRTWTRLALDPHHLCGVVDGKLYCYGDDVVGDLGHGDFAPLVSVPGPLVLSEAAEVAVGSGFSCAASSAGEVRCWGANQDGELGNGEVASEHDPFHVPLPTATINSLAVGVTHTCASVGTNGDVYCWGDNRANQVGAAGDYVLAPLKVRQTKDLVAAGASHTCARDTSSSQSQVECWGDNTRNQAPAIFAVSPSSSSPWPPPLVAGDDVTCAMVSGALYCFGALPGGTVSPTMIGGPGILSVAVGTGAVVDYLKAPTTGTSNSNYEFGTDCATMITDTAPPGAVTGDTTATAVFAAHGLASGSGHVCWFVPAGAGTTTGDLTCWGANELGQVSGSAQTCASMMVEPPPPQGGSWTAMVSLGGEHSCAIASDGTLYGWGDNSDNSLGSAAPLQTRTGPVAISPLVWSVVATGAHHTCAVTMAGTDVYCWGLDELGEVGNGKMFVPMPPADAVGVPR